MSCQKGVPSRKCWSTIKIRVVSNLRVSLIGLSLKYKTLGKILQLISLTSVTLKKSCGTLKPGLKASRENDVRVPEALRKNDAPGPEVSTENDARVLKVSTENDARDPEVATKSLEKKR